MPLTHLNSSVAQSVNDHFLLQLCVMDQLNYLCMLAKSRNNHNKVKPVYLHVLCVCLLFVSKCALEVHTCN